MLFTGPADARADRSIARAVRPVAQRATLMRTAQWLVCAGMLACALPASAAGPSAKTERQSETAAADRQETQRSAQHDPRRLARTETQPVARPVTVQIPVSPLEEVPYVQTPQSVVDAILALADVRRDDRLIDLGSGDGRIVITAARTHGAQGLGIELAPHLIDLSNRLAREAGVSDRARFVAQDLFDTDLSGASVVTMYLLPDVNLALRPKLLTTLAPGTRVVSHDWDMGDWRADRQIVVPAPNKPVGLERTSTLRLWIVPARIEGRWSGAPDRLTLSMKQTFQDIDAELQADGMPARRLSGSVSGRAVRLLAVDGGTPLRLDATVGSGRIEGSLSRSGDANPRRVLLRRD